MELRIFPYAEGDEAAQNSLAIDLPAIPQPGDRITVNRRDFAPEDEYPPRDEDDDNRGTEDFIVERIDWYGECTNSGEAVLVDSSVSVKIVCRMVATDDSSPSHTRRTNQKRDG